MLCFIIKYNFFGVLYGFLRFLVKTGKSLEFHYLPNRKGKIQQFRMDPLFEDYEEIVTKIIVNLMFVCSDVYIMKFGRKCGYV